MIKKNARDLGLSIRLLLLHNGCPSYATLPTLGALAKYSIFLSPDPRGVCINAGLTLRDFLKTAKVGGRCAGTLLTYQPDGLPPSQAIGGEPKGADVKHELTAPPPPPAKDPSPIQKITSAIKKKIPLITVRGSNKPPPPATTTPARPQLPTHDNPDTPTPTQCVASTAPVTNTAEEDETVTLKKSDLR